MKTAAKLTIAILMFCFFGIRMVSADTGHSQQEKWRKARTVKLDEGIAIKDRSGAIKPQMKDNQGTEELTKIYAYGNKGFGVASAFDPKGDGGTLKADTAKVKFIEYDDSTKICVKAFYKTVDASVKKTGATTETKTSKALARKDVSSSRREPGVWAFKATKAKVQKFEVGRPEIATAFTKETGEEEKNGKPT